MAPSRSGHDFFKLQAHIDLLTCRFWLVPTFKTATAQTAARNFVVSVFHDVGLPDVLVLDRNTTAVWTGLRAFSAKKISALQCGDWLYAKSTIESF